MTGTLRAEVLSDEAISEVVHAGRAVALRRTRLRLEDPAAPLAIERTTLPGGPTRAPIVLVHGLAQNRFTWRVTGRSLVAYLAEQGFDVLNLELRGHGESRAYGSGNAADFGELVVDLERTLTWLGRRAFVIGHSLGGAVAIGAASRTRVAGLVHLAGVYGFAEHNPALRALCHLSIGAESLLRFAPVRLSTGWAGDVLGRLYAISDIAGYGFPIAGWTPDSLERELLEERLRAGFDWESVEVWLQLARWGTGERPPWAAQWAASEAPVLVVAGDHDRLVTPEDAEAAFRACGSRDKQLLVFDSFHHGVHWGHVDLILGKRAPDVVWPALLAWLLARTPA